MANSKRIVDTAKTTVIITGIAVVSKILGFIRDAVLAHYYGSSSVSDIFITTLSIPDILFELIANSITIGFVPIATGLLKSNTEKKDINVFTSNVVDIFEVMAAVFALLFLIFAKSIIHVVAPGFQGNQVGIAVTFLRIVSLSMLFKTVSSVFGAYMQTNRNFVPVSMYGMIMDLVIIAFIIFSVRMGNLLLPLGVIFGVFVQMIFAIACTKKTGYKHSWSFDINDPQLRAMLLMFLPAIASTGANQIIQLINKGMATTIMEGGVTILSNANKMGYAAENIIVLSIAAVIYPTLSTKSTNNNTTEFSNELVKGLNCTFIIMIPLSVALILYSSPIIDILFGHGKYVDSVSYTSQVMKVYCTGIVGLSAYTIMTRALYAQKMIKQSAACSIATLLINISLCFLLAKTARMGLMGIALATSLSYTIAFVVTIIIMHRRIQYIGFKCILKIVFKTTISCIPMAILSYLTYSWMSGLNNVLALLCCAVVGAITYFICMSFLKVDEISVIVHQIIRKSK